MSRTIPFGFAIPSGDPVKVPLRHMVITGQTQEAGKTTALEAMVARAGLQAVVFVTKRGEGSFAGARTIPPYFREQTDWRYVAAVLEAAEGQKLKFERAWIMRAVKGAKTLAEVQRNVQTLGREAKRGMDADVYLVLDAYLQDVVPQIAKVRWAQTVALGDGINAMDLGGLSEAMQHLVIRSTLEWVLHSAERTVVVVPEAWKFIPQGRGTPVKLAAEAYIRQAAALKNYLWLDSQDIAGVEKIILKSCPVWILGVQREANEIQRTLDQIPGAKKRIHAEDVARLGLGQFYVCHGDQITKAYAQPRWLEDRDAQAIARGQLDVHSARLTDLAFQLQPPVAVTLAEESTVTEQEAAELREENTRLQDEARDLRARIEVLELRGRLEPRPNDGGTVTPKIRLPAERETVVHDLRAVAPLDPALGGEELYEQIKARLSAEAPQILKVLATRPELDVTVQRVTVELDGATPQGRIARLIADGFFAEPRAPGQVQAELARRGKDPGPRIVDGIRSLSEMGFFLVGSGRDSKSRVTTTYQAAPGIKVRTREIAA